MCKRLFLLTSFVLALSLVCTASGQPTDPHNVAVKGTATSSTTYSSSWRPEHAIDGDIDTGTHSVSGDPDKWWEVELDQVYTLNGIVVVNRSSCCGERIAGVVVKALDADRNEIYVSDPIDANDALLGSVHTFDNAGAGFADVRYIRLEGGTDFLQIMEVQAMVTWPYAWAPIPADGETEVDTTSLEWIAGDTAVSHKVYLSTDDVIDESDLAGETTLTMYVTTTLTPGATYYWRVDELDADGTVFEGDVWSFSMMPLEAHFPSPYDGKGNVMLDAQLSWTAGKDAIMHNVNFGTDAAALVPVSMMQMDATYDPGPLEKATTYYWRVDEFAGIATNVGPVWSFSTIPDVPALIDDPNLVGYWTFDEGAHTTALDVSGNNRHGSFRGDPQWAAGYEGGALELDGSGDYVNIDGYKGIAADRTDPDNPSQRPFTVACWVNTTTADGSLVCWGDNDGTGVGGQYQNFRMNGGRLRAEHGNGRFRGATRVDDGEWHHVAMVVAEGANIEIPGTLLFVDGVQDTEGADTVNAQNIWNITADSDVGIGTRSSHGANRLYTGLFDDVRIYDKALTAEEIAQVMRVDLLKAWAPSPADGSANQVVDVTALSWSVGDGAIMHNVHLGTDAAALAPVSMMQMDAIYALPEAPDLGQMYYWRVDEFNNDGTTTTGRVWNFTVDPFLLVDDIEGYTDYSPDRIFDVWADGWEIPTNGSMVGYPRPDFDAGEHFVETGIVHGGSQSMPYFFDTNYKYSEATLTLGYPRDWTEQSVEFLSLWFQGRSAGMVEEPAGTYTMTAAGADIWGTADQFRYAFKQLSGDATITARVVDNGTGSNAWAKGGVMIRQSLDPGSINVSGFITGGSGDGGTFQWRPVKDENSSSNRTLTGIAPPYYVRLVRAGNTFTCYMSADGVDWAQEGADPQTIEMTDPVLIGLAVTSHQSGEMRTYTFDNISMTDAVSGEWQVAAIGADMPSNDPAPMYVAVASSDGTTAAVYHDNPNASLIGNWTEWAINLQDFADQGVDLTDVDKISIGFGDKDNLQAGGSGIVFIDDIRLRRPQPVGHWKLDDGAGTIAVDSSSNGNDGTIVGNPTWIAGIAGGALEFHGLAGVYGGGDFIDCGNDASLDIAGPISIALWIRPGADDPEGQGTETAPMAKAMSGISPWNWQVRYGWGSPEPYMAFTFNTSPRAWAYVGKNLERDEWAHIACSHDGTTLKCYLNGVETDSTPMGEIAQGEAPVLIGSDGWGCDWIGAIDDVRIYDSALSADDVLGLAGQ